MEEHDGNKEVNPEPIDGVPLYSTAELLVEFIFAAVWPPKDGETNRESHNAVRHDGCLQSGGLHRPRDCALVCGTFNVRIGVVLEIENDLMKELANSCFMFQKQGIRRRNYMTTTQGH